MAALFIDLDGTCVEYHTNKWLPGVVDALTALSKQHKLYFVTMTGPQDSNEIFSEEARRNLIKSLPFETTLITNVPSPRLLIDDSPIGTIQTKANTADWIEKVLRNG